MGGKNKRKTKNQSKSKKENHNAQQKVSEKEKTKGKEHAADTIAVDLTKGHNINNKEKERTGKENNNLNEAKLFRTTSHEDRRMKRKTIPNKIYVRKIEEMDIIQSIYEKILDQLQLPVKPIYCVPGPPIAPYVCGEGSLVTLKWEVPYMSAEECPVSGYIIEVREENKWLSIHKDVWKTTNISIDIQKYNHCPFRIYAINQFGKSEEYLEYTISYQETYIQGLPNVGNTCYANSVFQVLAQTPNLVNHLLDIMTRSDINRDQSFTGILWKVLMGINKTPPYSDKNEIRWNIQKLINKICSSDGSFQIMEQNDSHSFMMTLFNGIKNEIGAQGFQDGVLSIFELFMATKYGYDPCGHYENADQEMFTSLLIPIDNYSDGMELHDGIKYLTEGEVFTDNILPCPFCESPPNSIAMKTTEIVRFPEILVLQLGKFREADYRVEKLHTRVTYDKTVVLQNGNHTCMEKYTLYGLTLHSGSIEGGHYFAYVKYQNKEDGTEQWYICNDSFITETNLRYILQDRGVSMLFYHKTEP